MKKISLLATALTFAYPVAAQETGPFKSPDSGAVAAGQAESAKCPSIRVAPRTGASTAAEFASSGKYSLDEDGILTFDYGTAYNGIGKFRNPYFISIYANLLYKDYLASNCSDEALKKQLLLQADWYIENAQLRKGAAVWEYPFASDAFDLKPGWISGIGQARIAGVLKRSHAITGNSRYHDVAARAMQVYEVSPAMGGVATKDGYVTWFEEAASASGESYKILNGHITALAGILDFYHISGEEKGHEVYQRGVAAVKRDIGKFDAGFLSYYSLSSPRFRQIAAKRDYNSLHVHQLLWLFEQTNDPVYLSHASRFQFYELAPVSYGAKGSIDPKGHGPDEAAGFYGSRYWSHSAFPTWLEVDTAEAGYFSGITVHATSEKSAPQDYIISARLHGKWTAIANDRGNKNFRRTINFTHPVQADAFRIDVERDNGNKNVTLQAFVPIWSTPQFAPITNECNYRARDSHYNYDYALDDDLSKSMTIFCPGWVILPAKGARSITLDATGSAGAHFIVWKSNDLTAWEAIGEAPIKGKLHLNGAATFIRISFGTDVFAIDLVQIE